MKPGRVLAILAAAELLAMAPWFSASAVAPALARLWHLGSAGTAGLTVSVQLGFVVGSIGSASLTLADIWSARRLVAAASWAAAVATVAVALSPGPVLGIAFRFATGVALAGVYPPGMKIAAGWFRDARGWAIGIMVGALTVGSALPHLVRWVIPSQAWQAVVGVAAASAVLGGALVLLVPHDGPFSAPSPPFSWSAAPRLLRDKPLMLANCGYLGHMWELYAMWTWMAAFVAASETARLGRGAPPAVAAIVTFAVIASGGLGCWLGGKYADRWGRTNVTSLAMVISGSCSVAVGFLFAKPLAILVPLLLVWGVTVVADSAQFSTAVSELAPGEYVGTALTLQTGMGFLLTVVTIYLLPLVAAGVGWHWSMSVLAIGPALGVWAMQVLKRSSAAARLAGGRG